MPHLPYRRGSERLFLEFREDFLERLAEIGFDNRSNLLERLGRHFVLEGATGEKWTKSEFHGESAQIPSTHTLYPIEKPLSRH